MSSPVARPDTHFKGNAAVRDIIIGMADGLTVPFALAAGLSAAVTSSSVVLIGGVAELAAGSIAMGLGGYLAARSDRDHYQAELAREQRHIRAAPTSERVEVRDILASYGLQDETLNQAVAAITANPRRWVDFMLRNELNLEPPDPSQTRKTALRIGISYIAGGILPLAPYAAGLHVTPALEWSAALTLIVLLVFGGVKGRLTGVPVRRASLETATVGTLAAAAAYLLAQLVNHLA